MQKEREDNEIMALKVTRPQIAWMAAYFDPSLTELDYEKDLHNKYLVLGFPGHSSYSIMTEETFLEQFRLLAHELPITPKRYIKK